MANTIVHAEDYKVFLDKGFQLTALSTPLEANQGMVMETDDPKYVKVPTMLLQGLGDYDRTAGYKKGAIDLKWTQYQLAFDRGRTFLVDRIDNTETLGIIMQNLAAQFLREHVVPEVDAIRFARLAENSGTTVESLVADSASALSAWNVASDTLTDKEVSQDGRIAFMTTRFYRLLMEEKRKRESVVPGQSSDARFATLDGVTVIQVPETRFVTKIQTLSGGVDEEKGGVKKADDGKNIEFQLLHTSAAHAITKHALPRIFSPDVLQDADAWKFDYRLYHDLIVLTNKKPAIYTHVRGEAAGG